MVMARRYKDPIPARRRRPGWIAWMLVVVLLLVAIASMHAIVDAFETGRDEWWLGVIALLIIVVAALRLALARRQSNAR
jgi:uncharacterized integral membrane protein